MHGCRRGAAARQADACGLPARADDCQLDELRFACIIRLARHLAKTGGSLEAALARASELEACGTRMLAQLLGVLTANQAVLSNKLPSAAQLAAAAPRAANPGEFEWAVERWLRLAGRGAAVNSSLLTAVARQWPRPAGSSHWALKTEARARSLKQGSRGWEYNGVRAQPLRMRSAPSLMKGKKRCMFLYRRSAPAQAGPRQQQASGGAAVWRAGARAAAAHQPPWAEWARRGLVMKWLAIPP